MLGGSEIQSTSDVGKFRRWLQDIGPYLEMRSADQDYLDFDLTNPQAIDDLLANKPVVSVYLTFVRHHFGGLFRFIDLVQGAVAGRLLPAIHYVDFLPRLAPTLYHRMLAKDYWHRFAIRHEDFPFEVLPLTSLTTIWNHAYSEIHRFGLAWYQDRDGAYKQRFLYRLDSNWGDDPRTWRPVTFDPVDAQRSRLFLIGLFFDLVWLARELSQDQAFAASLNEVLQAPPAADPGPEPQPFSEEDGGDQDAPGDGHDGGGGELPPGNPPAGTLLTDNSVSTGDELGIGGMPEKPGEPASPPASEPNPQPGTGPLKLRRQPRPERGPDALPKSALVVAPEQSIEGEEYQPTTGEEKRLMSRLMQKVNGDESCANRLIGLEAKRLPDEALLQWLISAIEQVERDETLCD